MTVTGTLTIGSSTFNLNNSQSNTQSPDAGDAPPPAPTPLDGGQSSSSGPTLEGLLGLQPAGTGVRTQLINDLANDGFTGGADADAQLDSDYGEAQQYQAAAADLISDPDFLDFTPTEEELRQFATAFSMVPGVGEAVDVATLLSPNASGAEKGLAALSLGLSIVSVGLTPNFGGASREASTARKVASQADGVKVFAKNGDGAADAAAVLKCFPAGTPVATKAGRKQIERIEADDVVWAYDFLTSKWQPCRVRQTFSRRFDGHSTLVTLAGETIESTPLHPFWVVRGENLSDRPIREHHTPVPEESATLGRWVDACDLRAGDALLLIDGQSDAIAEVSSCAFDAGAANFPGAIGVDCSI